MLRVVLHTDTGLVDLDTRDVSLQMNFSATDVTKLGSSKAAHSLSFKLPFSDINDEALGFFDLLDNSVETRQTKDADIYDEGALILRGILSIRSCDLQSRTYDCVVYAKEAGVWQLLKASTWADVFTSSTGYMTTALDHDHNSENVVKSNLATYNDVTDGAVGNDVIWYPLQYTATQFAGNEPTVLTLYQAQNLANSYLRYLAKDFLPAIQMQYLLQQLFLHCGYTLNTTAGVFAANKVKFHKMYQILNRENLSYRPYFQPYVSCTANLGVGSSGYYEDAVNYPSNFSFFPLAFAVWQTGDYDPDNFFGSAQQFGGFIPPVSGTFNMRLYLRWEFDGTPAANYNHAIGVRPYNFTEATANSYYQLLVVNTDDPKELTIDFQYYVSNLGVGQVYLPILLYQLPAGVTGIRAVTGSTKVQMVSYVGESPKISIPNSFGNETVDKWLQGVMTQFNLLLTTDEVYKTCVLHEKRDFYEDEVTNAKDWTDKVDRGKAMVVTNNLETLYRETKFQDKEGDDGKSKWLQEQFNKKYTDYTYRSGIRLAQPETTVGNYFAPVRYQHIVLSYSPTTISYNTDYPQGIQAYNRPDYQTVELALSKSNLLVYKGSQITWPTDGDPYRIYDSIEPLNDTYTECDVWQQPQPFKVGGICLSWQYKSSYDGFNTSGSPSLFEHGYEEELRKKYSKDARNLECEIWLDPLDIQNLSYSDLITIDGIYYHIDSVNNYVVGSRKSSKVRLQKLLDVQQVEAGNLICTEIQIGSIAESGLVTFVDRYGVEVDATQACCEFYGGGDWIWNAANETCNTGSVIAEDWDDNYGFRGINIPNPNTLFDPSQTQTILNAESGQGVGYKFKLNASTKSNVVAYATNSNGQSTFYVPQDCVAAMTVEYVAKVVSTTDFGLMEFGKLDATFRVEDNTIAKVSTDGSIIKNGDASSVSCVVSVSYASGSAAFTIDCQGHNGVDMEWLIDVQMIIDPIVYEVGALPQSIVLQDGDGLVTEGEELLSYES